MHKMKFQSFEAQLLVAGSYDLEQSYYPNLFQTGLFGLFSPARYSSSKAILQSPIFLTLISF